MHWDTYTHLYNYCHTKIIFLTPKSSLSSFPVNAFLLLPASDKKEADRDQLIQWYLAQPQMIAADAVYTANQGQHCLEPWLDEFNEEWMRKLMRRWTEIYVCHFFLAILTCDFLSCPKHCQWWGIYSFAKPLIILYVFWNWYFFVLRQNLPLYTNDPSTVFQIPRTVSIHRQLYVNIMTYCILYPSPSLEKSFTFLKRYFISVRNF